MAAMRFGASLPYRVAMRRQPLSRANVRSMKSRVLWNDPASGVMRHADAGYDIAIDCARENGLNLPMLGGEAGS